MATTSRARRDFEALEGRRMKAAALFGQGKSQAEVVRALQVSRQTASRWHADWKARGKNGLKAAGRAGRKPRLTPGQLRKVEAELLRGPKAHGYATELWTLPRVAGVIKKSCGVSYHPGHVWRLLRQMGWSCQTPTRRAKERDEEAIERWVKEKWPQIKKKPDACVQRLSSKTNPVSRSDPASAEPGRRGGKRRH
jgi:transposase